MLQNLCGQSICLLAIGLRHNFVLAIGLCHNFVSQNFHFLHFVPQSFDYNKTLNPILGQNSNV